MVKQMKVNGIKESIMAKYSCGDCGMEVHPITCGKCGTELSDVNIEKDVGTTVGVAECTNGC